MPALILLAGLLLSSSVQAQLEPDIRIDGDKPAGLRSADIRTAASGDTVYVFWRDKRNNDKDDILFNRSTDGGRNWLGKSEPVPGAKDVDHFRVAVWDNGISVVWKNEDGGLYSSRSLNQGGSWQNHIALVTDNKETDGLRVAVSGKYLYAVWEEIHDGEPSIYFSYSSTLGLSWMGQPQRDLRPR